MASTARPLGSLSMARGCARIDAGPDTAKIGSADRVQDHARLLAVIGVRKTFPHGLDPQQTLLPRRTGILPFRFRLPLNRQLLRFGDLCRGHLLRDAISIADRILVTSRSRQTEPHVCLNIVLRHA